MVYARVPFKEQEKEGFSIPAQLKLLRDYAMSQGLRIVGEYIDIETATQAGPDPERCEPHGTRTDPLLRPCHLRTTQTGRWRPTWGMQANYSPVWKA